MTWLPCPNPACPTVGRAHRTHAALQRCVVEHPVAHRPPAAAGGPIERGAEPAAGHGRADHVRAGVTVQLAERDRRLFGDTATVTAVGRCDFASCPHGNDCVALWTPRGSINRNRRNLLAWPLPRQSTIDEHGSASSPARAADEAGDIVGYAAVDPTAIPAGGPAVVTSVAADLEELGVRPGEVVVEMHGHDRVWAI
jgi:hypothetical protein